MKKKLAIMVMVLLVVMAGTALSAQGSREFGQQGLPGTGRVNGSPTELTGTLDVTGEEVLVVTGSGTYSLSARGGHMSDYSSYDGSEVRLSGLLTSDLPCPEGYDGHLFVEKAYVDDQEFAFEQFGRNSVRNSGRQGMPGMYHSRPDYRNDQRNGARSFGPHMYPYEQQLPGRNSNSPQRGGRI